MTRVYTLDFGSTGKTIIWNFWTDLAGVDKSGADPAPTVSEIGNGYYKFSFDVEGVGERLGEAKISGGTKTVRVEVRDDEYPATAGAVIESGEVIV